jgi:hypothetical protein
VNAALDIALIDIGAWGLAAIGAATFLAHRVADRGRLVNPPKPPPPDTAPLPILGGPSHGETT